MFDKVTVNDNYFAKGAGQPHVIKEEVDEEQKTEERLTPAEEDEMYFKNTKPVASVLASHPLENPLEERKDDGFTVEEPVGEIVEENQVLEKLYDKQRRSLSML